MSDTNTSNGHTPICGAKSRRTGAPCQGRPMANGRCHKHGGATPRGPAAPRWKDGRYSKLFPARLRASFEAAVRDPELLTLRREIALVVARMEQLLGRNESGEFEDDVWEQIAACADLHRKLVESERRRLVEMEQFLTKQQALVLMTQLVEVIRRNVEDRDALIRIGAEIGRITTLDVPAVSPSEGEAG